MGSEIATESLARVWPAGIEAVGDVFRQELRPWGISVSLIEPGSRLDLLGNALVLVAPKASATQFAFGKDKDLAPALGDGRLAIGDPQSVPAGKYAQEALTSLGLWAAVEPHLARAESVRAALALVDRGETPLGVVYRTDAAADAGVRIVDRFPESSHKPITYPVALVKGAAPPAKEFLAWLASAPAAEYFEKQGFTVLPRASAPQVAPGGAR